MLSGFIGPNLIHNILFKHGDTFWVITPFSSNIFMFVAAGFFILFCIGMIFESKMWNYAGGLFLLISIILGYYANFGNYTLVSEHAITIKNITKGVYQWDDIKEAIYIEEGYKKEGNLTVEGDKMFHLTFKDNKEETFEVSNRSLMANKIKQKLEEYDIEVQSK
ncbi:hypothetical protein E1I69_20800 [Bacillus timonensis]|uniref:Uncharacterized protein n=1 Tax=Bacillus timonensis TaxID=1033734 RepID=A0A4V3V736_9BACI|nr:hypothetical protein [Bacillus timonensis]THE09843.1 hypothetical protein E1I69_20800 [Bacillus timonensis]